MSDFLKWYEEHSVTRYYHNLHLNILTGKNGDIQMTAHDMISGFCKSWKVKVDPDCDFLYSVQKTQIKTIISDMNKFADFILGKIPDRLAEIAKFKIDYDYDIRKISPEAGNYVYDEKKGIKTA